jgi:hypothetical protein
MIKWLKDALDKAPNWFLTLVILAQGAYIVWSNENLKSAFAELDKQVVAWRVEALERNAALKDRIAVLEK